MNNQWNQSQQQQPQFYQPQQQRIPYQNITTDLGNNNVNTLRLPLSNSTSGVSPKEFGSNDTYKLSSTWEYQNKPSQEYLPQQQQINAWNQSNQMQTQPTYSQWSLPPPPRKWSQIQLSLSQGNSQQSRPQARSQAYSGKTHNKTEDLYTQLISQETSFDKETLKEIKRKSDLYEAAKEQITKRIRNNFEDVVNKIRETENEILDGVGRDLGENPFSTLLAKIHSRKIPTDAEVKKILSKEIPQDYGFTKEFLQNICKEIESFKTRKRKKEENVLADNFVKLYKVTMLSDCGWKKCLQNVDCVGKYLIDENNTRIATKKSGSNCYCTIIGNASLPLKKVVGWNVKLLKSFYNGGNIYIGVAPFDINQNSEYNKCGWYFHCGDSTLYSGPPHNYKGRKYGSKENTITGGSVGVMIDTTKGDLSFIVNCVNHGVLYTGIPLDKPLVPCVLLYYEEDSVELDLSKMKENMSSSIPVPYEIVTKSITWDSITFTWNKVDGASFYQVEFDRSKIWTITTKAIFTKTSLVPDSEHIFRVRTVTGNSVSEWSDLVKGRTQKMLFKTSGWKECPGDIDVKKYLLGNENPRIVKTIETGYCTIIGNTPLPMNEVTSWSIKVINSENNNGENIYIGIAPFNVIQNGNVNNVVQCGWYLDCFDSKLNDVNGITQYIQERVEGHFIKTGDKIGIVVDLKKNELSYGVNDVNYGVAYEGITLDKPLVPCVILGKKGDSVELDTSEVKEDVNNSVTVPSKIKEKSIAWDSITFTWNKVDGASFYQVEFDGSKLRTITTEAIFTKTSLVPDSEHSLKVRAVKGNSVSEWSDLVKGRTQKMSFKTSGWKECPGEINKKKYLLGNENPRIVKAIETGYCTIIGNTPLQMNEVTSWSIKVINSENNNGESIYIGVAPEDINQNAHKQTDNMGMNLKLLPQPQPQPYPCLYFQQQRYQQPNYNNSQNIDDNLNNGWFYHCGDSTLYSGPPHNYKRKNYGSKGNIITGDSVGINMDSTKRELSFVFDGVNYGVAYEEIPLDKPLVPCVILKNEGDSVELDTLEAKENVDSSISVPSNITTESDTWESIAFTWNKVDGASFYQIEVDGSKYWDKTASNTFTKRGFQGNTEHSFRVRAAKDRSVSKWSDVVKAKTKWGGVWKECPIYDSDKRNYSVDKNNPRVASSTGYRCTIIGNTPLPMNEVTSWSTKVINSGNNDGENIYIGVAPEDIDQNTWNNSNKCGWYFYCYDSTLHSGPPHNYKDKGYGSLNLFRKKGGFVHTGDTVGVVMDTTNGELSFVLGGTNNGVAYKKIPLDKPLVPCAILGGYSDSVELITL